MPDRPPRQLSLDPLDPEAPADKSAVDRARAYETVKLGHLERVEIEARVRRVIAKRSRRRPDVTGRCQRCGRGWGETLRSNAAGAVVCRECHCRAAAGPDDDRIETQAEIARVIRTAARDVDGPRRWKLADRALLIALAEDEQTVIALLDEVRRLGVEVSL